MQGRPWRHRVQRVAAIAASALLVACSGGARTMPATSLHENAARSSASLTIRLAVAPATASKILSRRAEYVSPATLSLTLTLTPAGGSAETPVVVPCTSVCSTTIAAPVGTDSIALSLSDASGGGGNVLSLATASVVVAPNVANSLVLTTNGVVDHVVLSFGATTFTGGMPSDGSLTVNAVDADGDTIVSPGSYVDAQGNPITISLGTTNAQAGGNGTISLAQTSFTGPSGAVTAHYDGNWLDHTTVAVSAPAAIAAKSMAASVSTMPEAYEYGVGITPGSNPHGITAGPDGALWFTESTPSQIGRVTTLGAVAEFQAGITAGSGPESITTGPDGNIWFTEPFRNPTNDYGRLIVGGGSAGTVTEFVSGCEAWNIITGPDGALWGTEGGGCGDSIDRLTTSGVFNYYEIFITGHSDIVVGPDHEFWSVNAGGDDVIHMNTSGAYSLLPITPGAGAQYIALGSDGNLWYTETASNCIGKITTAGAVTDYCSGITAAANLKTIVDGPDGSLWFTEHDTDKLGRIATDGTVTEYATGITAGAGPYGLTVGPDKNLWLTEDTGNRIAKFVL